MIILLPILPFTLVFLSPSLTSFLQPTMRMMMMGLSPRIYYATEARLLLLSTTPDIAAAVVGMSCFPADGISRCCAHPAAVRAIALISIHLKGAWSFSPLIGSTRTNEALHFGESNATTTTTSNIGANDVAREGHTILIAGGPTAG